MVYHKRFYNQEEKEEFLETIELDEVKNIYKYLFSKSKGAEILYQKDLYSFTLEQIEDVMRNVNPSTMNSAANTKSRINHYISWAIRHGRRENNINPIQGTTREWEKKFIDKNIKRHLTENELYDIIESLHNAQDQALVQCLFEGIKGQGLSELISMRYNKINWNKNIVTVWDKKYNRERDVVVSDRCMRYIENAYKQEVYTSQDTEVEKELVQFEDYIFKNVKWRASKFNNITRTNLTKRLYIIKEYFELDEFTAKTISEAGQIKMAADLIKERGKLEKEEFAIIGDQFGLPKTKVREYEYYDISKMKAYINSENLKKMYDVEIEIN